MNRESIYHIHARPLDPGLLGWGCHRRRTFGLRRHPDLWRLSSGRRGRGGPPHPRGGPGHLSHPTPYPPAHRHLWWAFGLRRHSYLRRDLPHHLWTRHPLRRRPHVRADLPAHLWAHPPLRRHPHVRPDLPPPLWTADALRRHPHLRADLPRHLPYLPDHLWTRHPLRRRPYVRADLQRHLPSLLLHHLRWGDPVWRDPFLWCDLSASDLADLRHHLRGFRRTGVPRWPGTGPAVDRLWSPTRRGRRRRCGRGVLPGSGDPLWRRPHLW